MILVPGDAERNYRAARAKRFALDAGTLAQLDEAAQSVNRMRGTLLAPATRLAAS